MIKMQMLIGGQWVDALSNDKLAVINPAYDEIFAEVQRANMQKERSIGENDPRSKRASSLDVIKPTGWVPPDVSGVIDKFKESRIFTTPKNQNQPMVSSNDRSPITPGTSYQRYCRICQVAKIHNNNKSGLCPDCAADRRRLKANPDNQS